MLSASYGINSVHNHLTESKHGHFVRRAEGLQKLKRRNIIHCKLRRIHNPVKLLGKHGHKLEIILCKFIYLFAESIYLIRIHTHSRRKGMSAVSGEAVCGIAHRLYHGEALHAACGASCLVAVPGDKHAGLAGVLHHLCANNADYAVMPALALYYNNSVVKYIRLLRIELIHLRSYILLKLLPAVVLLTKVAGKLCGAFLVLGGKQLRNLIGGTEPCRGVKLRRNSEGEHFRSQLFSRKSGFLHKSAQAGVRRFGNKGKPLPHQNSVFSG